MVVAARRFQMRPFGYPGPQASQGPAFPPWSAGPSSAARRPKGRGCRTELAWLTHPSECGAFASRFAGSVGGVGRNALSTSTEVIFQTRIVFVGVEFVSLTFADNGDHRFTVAGSPD